MDEFNIPIFKKSYELYQDIYSLRLKIPKQDRYTLWQRVENTNLDIIEYILKASELNRSEKYPVLLETSTKLNLMRVLIRLMKDVRAVNGKNYMSLQQQIDEVGRMLGGWIKSLKG